MEFLTPFKTCFSLFQSANYQRNLKKNTYQCSLEFEVEGTICKTASWDHAICLLVEIYTDIYRFSWRETFCWNCDFVLTSIFLITSFTAKVKKKDYIRCCCLKERSFGGVKVHLQRTFVQKSLYFCSFRKWLVVNQMYFKDHKGVLIDLESSVLIWLVEKIFCLVRPRS